MTVLNPQKILKKPILNYHEKTTVTLSFELASERFKNPADVVIALDRSGSMDCEKIKAAKCAAKNLIEIVLKDTEGDCLNRVGIVSFSDTATRETELTEDVSLLNKAVDRLVACGETNHSEAFEEVWKILEPESLNRKIVVMITDGETTMGGNTEKQIEKLKKAGVEIYCVSMAEKADILKQWTTDPSCSHFVSVYDKEKIRKMFLTIVTDTVEPAAGDILIREELNPDFKLTKMDVPTMGSVEMINAQTFLWTIKEAGLKEEPEKISLKYEIMNIGCVGGIKKLSRSTDYNDCADNCPDFPNPEVELLCDSDVYFPEECPTAMEFTVESCEDAVNISLNDVELHSLGRIVQVNVTIKDVCPGKRIAVGVFLSEMNPCNQEVRRGVKMFTVPPLNGTHCRNLKLKCIRFVVPEDIDGTYCEDMLCRKRIFKASAIANYIDTDLKCCCDI